MKRKLTDRILAALLSFAIMLSLFPLQSFAETITSDETVSERNIYYLFIDQQMEFGTITDTNEGEEYIDIYSDDMTVLGSEPEGEEQSQESVLFYKASQYEVGSEVKLQVNANDGYEIAEIFIEKINEENCPLDYTYNEETKILAFIMPDANIFASTTFTAKMEESDEVVKDGALDSSNTSDNIAASNGEGEPSISTFAVIDELSTGESTKADVYIRSLSTELFYGAEETEGGYIWTADNSSNGHRFSFRINYSISGVDTAPIDSVHITIPKSILKDREGNNADGYEMSIPLKADVDAYLNGTGESIDLDVNWGYYENGENIVIYNFREIPAGSNGYIEMSYFTSKTTFNYVDMDEQAPFTCTMSVPQETKSADHIVVKINTTAQITSTDKRYPEKYTIWQSKWGTGIKPANPENYHYLEWTIASNISTTQPYNFTLEDYVVGNFEGMEVLGYKFAGESEFITTNTIGNQTISDIRYDYVITSIPLDTYINETYWEANNTVIAIVDPIDNLDEDTQAIGKRTWTWTKPAFKVPEGHVNVYKRADGAYRTFEMKGYSIYNGTSHRAPSLDFMGSEYTRYDLETFNGYNNIEISNTLLDGFKYASWIVGYPYPWTYDVSYGDVYNPEAYGKVPIKYELIDDGIYLTNENENEEENSEMLTSEDFRFNSLGFSWYMTDAEFNEGTQSFVETSVVYTDTDIITFYGKFGSSVEWVQFASYNLKTEEIIFDDTYVQSMTNDNIVFKNDVDLVAYKISTINTHYYTELFTVPCLTLKNSETVMNYVTGKPSIGILNNNHGYFYRVTADNILNGVLDPDTLIVDIAEKDTEYARISQRYSDLTKGIVSVSNNTKKRTYTISWRVKQSETMEWGSGGDREYIPQNGGVFYDLLPEGSIFDRKSIDIATDDGIFLSPSAYTITTIDNYKDTGRTMLIVKIKVSADKYTVYYDTVHPWNSIKDYGTDVYNPVAYETGNDSITNGFADNGGQYFADGTQNPNAIKEASIMSELNAELEGSTDKKFIYAEDAFDIVAITAASSGLMKKVKAENDNNYTYETTTIIDGNYSYQLRFMNSYTTTSKNMIFFDSLENYDYDTMRNYGTKSDWRGTLQSIDINQLKDRGIDPVIYYSTISKLDIEENHDVSDTSVWNILKDETDLTSVKAIAIDMRKSISGEDFVLGTGDSVAVTLHMKAPAVCPEKQGDYAYTYNNIYISDTVFDPDNEESAQNFLIHQDYTIIKLLVTGSFGLNKVSVESENTKIEGLEFRLRGTSVYGTEVDKIAVTDTNGQIYFKNVEMGSYILQEYKTTDDWLLDTTEYKVVIDSTGKVFIDGIEYTDDYITIKNKPRIHGNFSFFKKEWGDDTVGVAGAVFRLAGTSAYGTNVLTYSTSINSGKVIFENIEFGVYEMVEVSTNENYELKDIIYTVEINEQGLASIIGSNEKDENGNSVLLEDSEWFKKNINGSVYIYNSYKYHEFTLRKIDEVNETVFLEGAIFSLTGVSDTGVKVDLTASSDRNGLVEFQGIEKGIYLLQEIQAPMNLDEKGNSGGTLNYLTDDTKYIVKIDYKGNVIIDGLEQEENTGNFIVKNARAYDKEIVVIKIWNDGLTSEERIAQGLIPKLHLTNRDLSQDENFHTHTWNSGVVLSQSTCAESGETLFTCTDCGMTNIQKEAKLEHIWDEGVTTSPTCTSEGYITYTCEVCSTTKSETIAQLPHTWNEGEVVTESTCAETGEKLYTCTVCRETKTEPIEMLPHVYNEGVITTEPTCSSTGLKLYTCLECGGTKTKAVAPLPHTLNGTGTCTVCGLTLKYTSVIMTGAGSETLTVSTSNYDYYSSSRPYYSKIITFIPIESGTYTFEGGASGDTYGRLYGANMISLSSNDDAGMGSNFLISYYCTAGTIYYLSAGCYSNSSNDTSIPVTITKIS